ncbi:3-methyl-2-oxobutanoate hydroxymethyltransferase [Acetobacter sp. AN02]|uniref:3-methyl-2-oxobutanoate hydroxymethyltransferase n=1 Tax=Acetobacter sp. AN02 TaxID=2894186 RepID=UPI0024345B1E|nr:3-methyl-2-oxobutanoate hydroxymethyltransferase [Acetobacter sp. AN02]MDG6093587.1 3-methyl-2-oxobutanoate hydroxymethyltransferase [Acetobacter sp. AN02]
MRRTIFDFQKMKQDGEKIVMLTAYDYPSALLAERAEIPVLLVGDSAGMVVHGHDTTIPVTVDDMIGHARAVMRGSRSALVVVDMPFLSYGDVPQALQTARRLMQEGGAPAVKLEGGEMVLPAVRALVASGVPVMGHLGLTPQSQHTIGLRVQAKGAEAAGRLIRDAQALEAAGAFGVVLEVVPAELAAHIAGLLTIPVIGIGAGAGCDGQVQVWHDVLGLFEGRPPRHASVFAPIGRQIEDGLKEYAEAVRMGTFPTKSNSSSMDPEILREVLES